MNRRINQCNTRQMEAFLEDRLSESEQAALIKHLDHCVTCRGQIGKLAADPETWDAADSFLADEAFDSVCLGTSELLKTGNYLRVTTGEVVESMDAAIEQVASHRIENLLSILSPTDDPRMLGRLGGYEISGVVGAGGMGVVLKGYDPALARVIAIKVLMPHLATCGAARQRFAREAKAAATVLHPNVIAIHSVSTTAELPYLVMPYVRGRSLQKRLDDQGQMELKEVLRVGCQVAAGLAAAHAQGLVHRDIKPANILLEDGVERVTLTDFGLARAVDDATLTRSGVIAGTPLYMSPEQAGGEPIDARSDLFSLGSVLYTMCAGRPPFRADTSLAVLRRIADQTPRPVSELNPNIPPWMSRLVERLHAKRPEQRIQSATEVEQLLQQCLAHLEQPQRTPLPESLQEPQRWPTKRTLITAIAIMGLTSIFGLLSISSPLSYPEPDVGVSKELVEELESDDSGESPVARGLDSSWNDRTDEELAEIEAAVRDLEQIIEPDS